MKRTTVFIFFLCVGLMKTTLVGENAQQPDRSTRRDFIKGVAVVGAAAAIPEVVDASHESRKTSKKKHPDLVSLFRFKVRGTRSCNACDIHHKYKVFLTRAFADTGRAHPGCNCPIVVMKVSKKQFNHWFKDPNSIKQGSVDLRTLGRF
ncbi:MAG TPA: twin-arginine translocation signal domain-containing protein [Acidobacteriota bacterium]|nr:twin-arginine translocation signal domain-containing protein [Acidobacteriota bacterium]